MDTLLQYYLQMSSTLSAHIAQYLRLQRKMCKDYGVKRNDPQPCELLPHFAIGISTFPYFLNLAPKILDAIENDA